MLNRRPRGSALCWMMAFFTTSYHQLLWTPTHQGSKGPIRRAFSTTSCLLTRLISNCNSLSRLSYIIVYAHSIAYSIFGMAFDRHQAEITVMQFTGYSLPVHQSMSVPWEFFFYLSHFISQFPPTRFPLITAIRMCHFLPVHHLGMAFLAGSMAKIQHKSIVIIL